MEANVNITSELAESLIPMIRGEVIQLRARGNNLMTRTNNRSAAQVPFAEADRLEALANALDVLFPVIDDEG
jgi:hypothetical protein